MSFYLGLVLFAFLILVSVALHECGHMWAARVTGMKVRRYFVGFGPTLWSTRRPNKLGSTEYGIKAIPLGGFCDIAGMTSVDEIAPEDEKYAMYKQKVWKRVFVLFAGPAMNIVIGLVLIYAMAVSGGLPSLHPPASSMTAVVTKTSCVAPQIEKNKVGDCTGQGPAAAAGIKEGDVIVRIGATEVHTPDDVISALKPLSGPVIVVVKRDGQEIIKTVDVTTTQRFAKGEDKPSPAGAIGIGVGAQGPGPVHYSPLAAVPATFNFTGDLTVELGKSLAKIPTKMGALVHSLGGGERDPETPISVVGASIIGGDTVELGLWLAFWFFLASLNFILAVVNLIPLLPFDGGHMAVATYEKIRDIFRSARGKASAGPVNYLKLMPATYVVLVVLVGYMVLTVAADFINPLRPFK
jgi:membrane-associated protease RseP (regulator of RpoE activity)